MAISLSGIEQAISALDYRNPHSPKSILIGTIQEYYRRSNAIDEVRVIDTDALIDRMWHLSGDPVAIKAKRKNLNSVKSSVNSDLDAAWDRGENSEGLSIGPLNTFVISDAAKNKILESFTGSFGAGDGITLDRVAEALKIVADYLSKSPVDAEDSKMSVLKNIIGDLSRQFGEGGAGEFEVVEKGASGTTASKALAAGEALEEVEAQADAEEEFEEVEVQTEAEGEELDEVIEASESLDEDALEEIEAPEVADETDEIEVLEELSPEEVTDPETDDLEAADAEEELEEVMVQAEAEGEELEEVIEAPEAMDGDILEDAEETEIEDEADEVVVVDESVLDGEADSEAEVLEDLEDTAEEELEEVEVQEEAEDEELEEVIETPEAMDEDILEEIEAPGVDAEEVEFVDESTLDEETDSEVSEDLEEADAEEEFEEVEVQDDAEDEELEEVVEATEVLDEDISEETESLEADAEAGEVEVLDELSPEEDMENEPEGLEDLEKAAEEELEEVEVREESEDEDFEEVEVPEESEDEDFEEVEVQDEAEDGEIEEVVEETEALDEDIMDEVEAPEGQAEELDDLEEAAEEEFDEVDEVLEGGMEELEEVEADEIVDEAVLDDAMDELESVGAEEDLEEVETGEITAESEDEDASSAAPELMNQIGLPIDQFSQDSFDFDEFQADAEQKRLLAEAFDGYLGAMERYYNQYLLVPKGEYRVGSEDPEQDVLPPHSVSLPDFYMGKYPVTNALFEIFIERTGYKTAAEIKGYGYVYYGRFQKILDPKSGYMRSIWNPSYTRKRVEGATWYQPLGPGSTLHMKRNHPVVQVSMRDARAFSAWTGKRLPTEIEWEGAARTRKGFIYPWGEEWRSNLCNLEENELSDTSPVDAFPDGANEIGLADLLGNVMEWTSDECESIYPVKKAVRYHIVKGAAWVTKGRSALYFRNRVEHDLTSNILGFRCVAD